MAFTKRLERVRAAGTAVPSQESAQRQEANMIDVGRPQYDSPPPLAKTLFGPGTDGGAGSDGSGFGLPQARSPLSLLPHGITRSWPPAAVDCRLRQGTCSYASTLHVNATDLAWHELNRLLLVASDRRCGGVAGAGGDLRGLQRRQRPDAEHAALTACGRAGRRRAAAGRRGAAGPAGAGGALRGAPRDGAERPGGPRGVPILQRLCAA